MRVFQYTQELRRCQGIVFSGGNGGVFILSEPLITQITLISQIKNESLRRTADPRNDHKGGGSTPALRLDPCVRGSVGLLWRMTMAEGEKFV
jgi:hypothetical protein